MNVIYCDNAATSFPKPRFVPEAMIDFMSRIGASPGRSTHTLGLRASRAIFDVREKISAFFNVRDSSRMAFCGNATEAINTAILGVLSPHDRVVVSALEHNSVMRPLGFLAKDRNITVTVAPCDEFGMTDPERFERTLKSGVKLAVVNHGSNVSGSVAPVEVLGKIARSHGAVFMVDSAQTAGIIPIDVEAMNIDVLAFSGHKSLYGPMGVGGLYVREGISVRPLKYGGTGSNSDSDDQPEFSPDIYESGTLNAPGIAGLGAGLDFVLSEGFERIQSHGFVLAQRFCDKVRVIPGITVIGSARSKTHAAHRFPDRARYRPRPRCTSAQRRLRYLRTDGATLRSQCTQGARDVSPGIDQIFIRVFQ